MKVLYFAWLRERIGLAEEDVEAEAPDVSALVEALRARSPAHAAAFADVSALRVAVDQEAAGFDAPLKGAREVAFFPPVTGG
ncbi:molybdopterin converting factor subunit 1 [Oceanicella actignis]|uniref:Molybdopterin synthase sulfur carrier subunit n=1 Tax=Oceanicella actignis TaxID=1189325 RepID=A0A1M7TSK4_9RHOB|nr:molybdopterin converting factor subunit 1 [Oceanicella actignis]TYO85387.1 molybdopterin synthase sulfur carrier subunit [Oceanicella actignis]SET76489.1 molybdopterin synthase sulfur carrier subunit [Oceanicella actignis]SHN73717.1 molybdopterin synthase sulfur carrier subunit [Oceanicella actignis]